MATSLVSTGVTFPDGTTQTTAAAGGGVTSLNGQTGAITDTSYAAIGSYVVACYQLAAASITPGTTVSGSTLKYSSGSGGAGSWTALNGSNYSDEYQYWAATGSTSLGLSGTWRAMTRAYEGSTYGGGMPRATLFVRIS